MSSRADIAVVTLFRVTSEGALHCRLEHRQQRWPAQRSKGRNTDCVVQTATAQGMGVSRMRRIVLGMTGATGAVLGIQLLRRLQQCPDVETHLVLSRWARATIHLETELSARDVEGLADIVYSWDDQVAAISLCRWVDCPGSRRHVERASTNMPMSHLIGNGWSGSPRGYRSAAKRPAGWPPDDGMACQARTPRAFRW